ncbi:MAG: hypothetical protein MZV64_31500 [Ignavibacteriales bacterium]|nr:hypothetical protein [Ignavibacteriales bacterium]
MPQPDTLRYTWVTQNDSTFLFPLDTLFRRFAVVVRAVDDAFAGLPEHAIVRMTPAPYWDKNDNGMYDGADEQLPSLVAGNRSGRCSADIPDPEHTAVHRIATESRRSQYHATPAGYDAHGSLNWLQGI